MSGTLCAAFCAATAKNGEDLTRTVKFAIAVTANLEMLYESVQLIWIDHRLWIPQAEHGKNV